VASVAPGSSGIQASKKLPVAPSPKNQRVAGAVTPVPPVPASDLGRAAQIHRALGDDRPIRADDAAEVGDARPDPRCSPES
jgi:hypothetical protein